MKPYFDTSHAAGALLLIAVLGWAMIEISHLGNRRRGATKLGGAGRRYTAWPFLASASVMLYLGSAWPPWAMLPLAAILLRIRTEERALLVTLGAPYRAYAAHHKRLVPLVW